VTHAEPHCSVIVPCFNEEDGIAMTVGALLGVVAGMGSAEIIVVDDGSCDRSAAILESLAVRHPELRVLRHERNRGYGASLKTGIRRARSEIVVITDADGTYPTERIPELVAAMADADMVVGSRTGQNVSYSKLRMVPKVFLRWYCSWISGRTIPDINSGLRVLRKSIVERFISILPDGFSFTTTITIAMHTNYYNVVYVPIDYTHRIGRSKIKPIRDTLKFLQLITRTGTYFAPLRVLSPVVLLLFFAFFSSLLYDIVVLRNLTDKTILLLLFSMNTGLFALLADMIDKRTNR
jgi:glycosyltransferase involved in cell wall biosynthesis